MKAIPVDQRHQKKGQKEGENGRAEHISWVVNATVVFLQQIPLGIGVEAEDERKGEKHAEKPAEGDRQIDSEGSGGISG